MILSCSSICKSFGSDDILKNASFHIEEHEKAAVVGINGAGKSTLLKIITGELPADSGEVVISKGKTLGYLAQNQDLLSHRTIYDEMLEVKRPVIEMEERLRELEVSMKLADGEELEAMMDTYSRLSHQFDLINGYAWKSEIVGVLKGLGFPEEEFGKQISTLSGGQKTRVSLGKLLLTSPDIILLDEPTSHLDVKYKLEFLSLLREMARKKELSVIMSLHELDLAERISDRVVCIKDGRMDRCGTPEQVFTPGYVEELFGMTAGKFDAAGGSVEFSVPGGAVKPEDLPENAVFVIAGNGSGRQVFRKLQRENVPFVTGILFENDLDLPAAEALAAHVVKVPLGPVPEEAVREARAWIRRCQRVICCRTGFGVWEKENEDLFKYAERSGKTAGES